MTDEEIIAQLTDDIADVERRLELWRGTRLGLDGLHAAAADRTIRTLVAQLESLEQTLDEMINA